MVNLNLIEVIERRLGLPPLHKIDPNTQEVNEENFQSQQDKLAQAAIPAVLAGLYLFATYKEGAETILRGNKSTGWVNILFKSKEQEAIDRVAQYAGTSHETTEALMESVADEAIHITREHIPSEAHANEVNEFFTAQRDKILLYLPAALQMGQLLKDDTLDDRTNKMLGPVSGFMQRVAKVFSSGTKDTEPGLF